MPEVVIGKDSVTGELLTLGDIERRSGLYVLGKPGMGKSALIVNVLNQDIEHGHGGFFLDPHGDAITDLLNRGNNRLTTDARLFDVEDEEFSFGINLLTCKNIKSFKERNDTYARAYNVFYKLWEQEWGPWLQLIIENTLWAFIENQDYTLAEVPMFLNPRNRAFRDHIVGNIKHNSAVVDFWDEFFERRERDQQAMVDAALTRVNTLLSHPYVRDIIGQKKTTVDFSEYLNSNPILLFKLSANLSPDIKKFVGTILVSELLHAVRNRPENRRGQFCIFVDEFQNFASSDDFTTLITEARKFGIATTIVHVERFGQFAESRKLLGATLATVNKVFFQVIVPDAEELAPEFAKETTTTETRLEPELVIHQNPFFDLLRRGHANPKIHACVYKYLEPMYDNVRRTKEEMEAAGIIRSDLQDESALLRDEAAIYRLEDQREGLLQARGRDYEIRYGTLSNAMDALQSASSLRGQATQQSAEILRSFKAYQHYRQRVVDADRFLLALMEGRVAPVPGEERFAQFLVDMRMGGDVTFTFNKVYWLYLYLRYGDPRIPRSIPALLAVKYWPKELEEAYLQKWFVFYTDSYRKEQATYGSRNYGQKWEFFNELIQKQLDGKRIEYQGQRINISYVSHPYVMAGRLQQTLPDLPPRVLTGSEIELVKEICSKELREGQPEDIDTNRIFTVIDELTEFCTLLAKPENHIKVPSGQYIEKPVSVRLVSDMTNEMAQELANLPRFTAFAKVIEEREGEQTVLKKKIKTLPLPQQQDRKTGAVEEYALAKAHAESKKRDDIEEEIRQRQERWWRRRERTVSQPPPSEEPPGRR